MIEIRPTTIGDMADVLRIYDKAREYMRRCGNMHQWTAEYPGRESLTADIEKGCSYVCLDDGRIFATFFFIVAPDATYTKIYGGSWLNDRPYGVIHRAASDGTVRGTMRLIVNFCRQSVGDIRIDTHSDNTTMQRSLLRYGFHYCGIIHLANGDERRAYHFTGNSLNNGKDKYL